MAGIMFEKEATKISNAILNNDMAGLRAALSHGEDPHHKDRKENTYLHYVCTMHRPLIIHIIVGTGTDVNARNRHGNTALHVTALQHECCHVGDLLAAGIDPTIKNKDGKTAAEIPTRNKFWKSIYDKYQPGIFEAIASHDVEKVLYLLHCWSRVDSMKNGQTLRQFAASHKFHDIVFHIDVHRYTLGAMYSVLEGDVEKAWSYMSHVKCDINFLNYATKSSHILQHAIKLQDIRLVNMICKSRVNVNIRVTVQGYLKAALFFAAIDPKIPEPIFWTVLNAGADCSLKDERGRNAAIYALDKTKGKVHVEVIAYMLKHGLDVAERDETGATLRDVARFAGRQDIVALIDKAYVQIIRSSNMAALEKLAVMGYDGLLIDFNHRDTFTYASGNETSDVLTFTQKLPEFYGQVRKFHLAVCQRSIDEVHNILAEADRPDLLLNSRDKGGRSAMHLCILHWRFDVLKMLLAMTNIDVSAVDNLGRTAYHYACALDEKDKQMEFCQLLENAKIDTEILDNSNHKASYNLNNANAVHWLGKERKTCYGMEKQLACVDKYEELCRIMKYKRKQLKHFDMAIRRFKYPVSQLSSILSPLMSEYRDLVILAMDRDKEDIAVRLIQLGTDWRRKEFVDQKELQPDGAIKAVRVLMSVAEYAKYLGMNKVVMAVEKKKAYFESQIKEEVCEENENDKSVKEKNLKIVKVRKMARNEVYVNDRAASFGWEDEYDDVYFEEEVVDSTFDVDPSSFRGRDIYDRSCDEHGDVG